MSVLSKYVPAGLGILAAIIPCLVFRLVDRYTSLITDTISWSEIALAAAYFRPECAAQEKELPQ